MSEDEYEDDGGVIIDIEGYIEENIGEFKDFLDVIQNKLGQDSPSFNDFLDALKEEIEVRCN